MHRKELLYAMKAMGWNPDADIPMANEDNINLLKEIDNLVNDKAALEKEYEEVNLRTDKLSMHLKHAEECITVNLRLLEEYKAEVITEVDKAKVVDRERSKYVEDHKNMDKDLGNLQDRMNQIEAELDRKKKNVEKLTNRIKSSKAVLAEWNCAMEDSQKGYELIEKYFKEDEYNARQKDLRRQMLGQEICKARQELVTLYDEQKSLEQNLDRTATLYRSAHAERRQMVDTWKTAVNQMTQRERDIQDGEISLNELQRLAQMKLAEMKGHDNRLNSLIENNREVEESIEELNNTTSDIKDQIQMLTEMISLKENEVDILQKELSNLAGRVQQQRMENRSNAKAKIEKIQELEGFSEVLRKLEERFTAMESKNMTATQRLQILEDMNDQEEKIQADLNKETYAINSLIYRSQQQSLKLKNDKKVMENAGSALAATIQAIKRSIVSTEKQLRQETEIHYNLGFKCLQIERKIIKLQGGVVDPEEEQRLQAQLADMELHFTDVQRRVQITEAQNKKLDDNMRKLTITYNTDSKELEVMKFKIKEAQVYCEGGVKRLKNELNENQVLIVELSILKMRVDEFEKEIADCENSSHNLDKHRSGLIATIEKRMLQIKAQLQLLSLKRKHMEEEKATLRADIGERNKALDALRSRFELTRSLLGKNSDGTLVTATQLRVEAAQEKQMLLDEGNKLNEMVIQAENDIQAMENTLTLMNSSNANFRDSMLKVDKDAESELKKLHDVHCEALAVLKSLRKKVRNRDIENNRLGLEKEELDGQLQAAIKRRMENEDVVIKLRKELQDQKDKIERADREMTRAFRDLHRLNLSAEHMNLFIQELDMKELECRNTKVLNQLADLADDFSEIGVKICKILAEKGLKLPHQLSTARSFSSWRSDMSGASLLSQACRKGKKFPPSSVRSSQTDLTTHGDTTARTSASGRRSSVTVVSVDLKL